MLKKLFSLVMALMLLAAMPAQADSFFPALPTNTPAAQAEYAPSYGALMGVSPDDVDTDEGILAHRYHHVSEEQFHQYGSYLQAKGYSYTQDDVTYDDDEGMLLIFLSNSTIGFYVSYCWEEQALVDLYPEGVEPETVSAVADSDAADRHQLKMNTLADSKENMAVAISCGFDSPEECVEAYISYLSASDVGGMLSTAAIDQVARNASLRELCAQSGFWDMNSGLYFEGIDDLAISMNRLAVQGAMAKKIYYMLRTFSDNPVERTNEPFKRTELPDNAYTYVDHLYADDVQTVVSSISLEAIYSAEEVIQKLVPDQANTMLDQYTNSYARYREMMEYLHADDFAELCAAFHTEADGRQAYLFLPLVKYDGRWFINPLSSSQLSNLLGSHATSGGLILY